MVFKSQLYPQLHSYNFYCFLQIFHRPRHSVAVTSLFSASHTHSDHTHSVHRHSQPNYQPSTALPSLTLHTPPLESAELLLKFLKISYQLERLKYNWSLKILGNRVIKDDKELSVVESAYRDKVYNWACKWVAKKQRRELTRMQMESVNFFFLNSFVDFFILGFS